MSWFVVDIETDGPCPGLHSMVSFAAYKLDRGLETHFEGKVHPVSDIYDPECLAISGTTRELHLTYPSPAKTMREFAAWLYEHNVGKKMTFVSDNPAFDFGFINYYFHRFALGNPFGYSARRIGDMYSGMKMDSTKSGGWRDLRQTEHTHDPLMDAKGMCEALLKMHEMGFKIPEIDRKPKIKTVMEP